MSYEMETIVNRAKEIRKKNGGGHIQHFKKYGGVPIPEFYEAFLEHLHDITKDYEPRTPPSNH